MTSAKRRPVALILDLLLVLFGAAVGIASSFAVGTLREVPWLAESAKDWALPTFASLLLVVLMLRVWVYRVGQRERRRVWKSDRPPFPGLEAFTEQDVAVYFGREREVDELFERLHPTRPTTAARFVPVVGPSGAGKSSLVQAGLLPRLISAKKPWIIIPTFVPGDRPAHNLVGALTTALGEHLAAEVIVESAVQLAAGDHIAFIRLVDQIRISTRNRLAQVLIVIDQAEELVTLTGDIERRTFLALVGRALDADSRLWVVSTLRVDFFSDFLSTDSAHLFAHPLAIGVLGRDALLDVIEKPAIRAGVDFEPAGLPHILVNDTGSGTGLPLLAYTLQTLYLHAGKDATITIEDYRRLGGVAGALTQRANAVMTEFIAADADGFVLPTLLRFVTMSENGPTRRPVAGSDLSEAEWQVVEAFVAARLLISDVINDGEAGKVYEVAHEALFRHWPPLRQTIETYADELQRQADLERWALDWVRSGRQQTYLLRSDRLADALSYTTGSPNIGKTPLVQRFLESSQQADQTTVRQLADFLSRRALAVVEGDPEYALTLALSAIDDYAYTPLAGRALVTALMRHRTTRIVTGGREIEHVAWSPDGHRVAGASYDGTARIWDADSGNELLALHAHDDRVWAVAWSWDGQRLATGSRDGTVRVWDAHSGNELLTLRGHREGVWDVAWSPDGKHLAAGSYGQTVRMWDSDTGVEVLTFDGHDREVCGIAWSPDGQRIATGSRDRTVRIWDAHSGNELLTLRGHEDGVWDVAWSPNGEHLASVSDDRTIRVWRADDGTVLLTLQGHSDRVWGAAWSPDGQRIATGSRDRTVRIWDAHSGNELLTLRGHQDGVVGLTWSPDSQRLCSGSLDRTIRMWDVRTLSVMALRGHQREVFGVAWSPDGQRIATGSDDRTVVIWDPNTGVELLRIRGHDDSVWGVGWSPNGLHLATGSLDRTVRVWNADTGAELLRMSGHQDWVSEVAWSPDGRQLATAAFDQTVRIWDTHSGVELLTLRGDEEKVRTVAWAPNGRYLASGDDAGAISIWTADSGALDTVFHGHTGDVWCVAWAPDSERVAASWRNGRMVQIWDVHAKVPVLVLDGHDDYVWGVAWSPDGTQLATASIDRTARIWDANSGNEIIVAGVHSAPLTGVSWSPNGQRIATSSQDGMASVWNATATMEDLIAEARSRVRRRLTEDERRDLLLASRAR